MVLNKFFSTVLVAILYGSSVLAAPWPSTEKHATHRTREIRRDLKLETFHPASTFETFGTGIDHPLAKRADATLEQTAISFTTSRLKLANSAVQFKSGFAGEAADHAYLKQVHDGIPFANAVANVALNKDNKVVAFGSSFVKPSQIAASTPTISLEQAIASAEKTLDGTYNQHPASLEYLAKDDNTAVLTHVVQIENESTGAWVEAFVDAHSGEVVSITDFVAKASYLVVPFNQELPTDGFQTITDPQDPASSPNGWHSDGTTSTTTTAGNNVIAFKGTQTNVTSQSSTGLVFNYPVSFTTAPTTTANVNAARVNAFYVGNSVHDVSYRYGFTEAGFNFQNNNFGKGGAGNDRVTISVQDSAGTDNADFSTPPDGQSGRMRMFLWDLTNPERDGALENDIVTHEYTHGITNRLTGGGTARCLQTTEAGGLGEGWSDAMADWAEKKNATVSDFAMGQWVINDPAGIRSAPYSTNTAVNNLRYSTLKTRNEVHDIGEVWATLLHVVYGALVNARGWSATSKTNPTGTEGNIVHLHLFIDALSLQPCNPTFITARDAWIQADANRYAGANRCTLWRAFASRGLGQNATSNRNDDATIPSDC